MTDVGIRASAFDHQHPLRLERAESRQRGVASASTFLLQWDLLLASAAAVAISVPWSIGAPAVIMLLGCWAGCLALTGASRVSVLDSRARELARVVRAGAGLALAGSALSLVPAAALTTGDAFAAAAAFIVASCGVRTAAVTRGQRGGRVVVIGDAGERQHAVAALSRLPGPLEIVTACLAPAGQESAPGELAITLDEVPAFARQVGAHSVVAVPGAGLDPVELRRLRWLLDDERMPCLVGTALMGVATDRITTIDISGVPLVRVNTGRTSGPSWVLVEWWDRCLAALALAVLSPLLMMLVMAIRWGSPGPAIFRQTRIGRNGRPFTIYKLRTMVGESLPDTTLVNDHDGVLFKMRRDPRVTPLGAWLRKYSVDELPQLLNVVRGQMRLVGPRPALPDEVARYTEDERRRLAMPPGITGLWQVSGRSDLNWNETVRLDLHYVDNWSPRLDLIILCRTVRAVVGHRGAY